MSHYMALWKQPQKVIFDLPNGLTDIVSLVYPTISFHQREYQWDRELNPYTVDGRLQHYVDGQLLQCAPGCGPGRCDPYCFLPPVE